MYNDADTGAPARSWARTDAAAAHNRSATTQIVVSRALPSALSVAQAMRSQFESKDRDQLTSAFDVDWSFTSDRHDAAVRSVAESQKNKNKNRKRDKSKDKNKKRASGSPSPSRSQTAVHESEVQRTRTTGEGSREPERERDLERGLNGHSNWREQSISEEDEGDGEEEDFELDVRVEVEQTVTVEYDPEAFATESYRTPRRMWGAGDRSVSSLGGRASGRTDDGRSAAGT